MIERIRANQVDVLFRRRRYLRGDGTTVTVNASSVVADTRDGYALHVAAFVEPGRTEWIEGRIRRDDELNAALAEVRAALLRGDPTDAVFRLICDCTRDLLACGERRSARARGLRTRPRPGDRQPPTAGPGPPRPAVAGGGRRLRCRAAVGPDRRGTARRRRRIEQRRRSRPADGRRRRRDPRRGRAGGRRRRRFGALVVRRALIAFTDTEVAVLEAFAAGVGDALTVAETRADLERLRVLEVRQQIARNLHDEVIQDLIGVRLGLVALCPGRRGARRCAARCGRCATS